MKPQRFQSTQPGDDRRHDANGRITSDSLESHGFSLLPFLQPGFDVLDASSEPGGIATSIAEAVFPGRVTSAAPCAAKLERARRLAEGKELVNISFLSADATRLPFAPASFDVVFAHASLDHVSDPRAAIAEFHRVTRPGGFLVACSPDWDASSPLPKHPGRAVEAYRRIVERRGGTTRAAASLAGWLGSGGFTLLAQDSWIEHHDEPGKFAERLAGPLETEGQFHHATALRDWAARDGATFGECWRYATAVRADSLSRSQRVWE